MVQATLAVTLGLDEVYSLEGLTSCRIYTRSRHSRGTNGRSAVTPSPERRNAQRRPHRKGDGRRANLLDPRRYTGSIVRGRKRASASFFPLRFACKLRIYE